MEQLSRYQSKQTLYLIQSNDEIHCYYLGVSNREIIFYKKIKSNQLAYIMEIGSVLNPKQIFHFIDNGNFSLNPTSLFLAAEEYTFTKRVFPTSASKEYNSNQSYDQQVVVSFQQDEDNESLFEIENYYNFHISTPLINNAVRSTALLSIYFVQDHVYITLGMDHLLKFHNRFHYQSTKDVLFYVSKLVEMYGYDQKILVGGEINSHGQIGHQLQAHFNHVEFYNDNIELSRLMLTNYQ